MKILRTVLSYCNFTRNTDIWQQILQTLASLGNKTSSKATNGNKVKIKYESIYLFVRLF